MTPMKISLTELQVDFVNQYQVLGFPDKSSVVRAAIDQFREEWEKGRLEESAKLYSEVYSEDENLRHLTDAAIEDWPK